MKPLYELGDALESISAELEANDGELTDDLAARLDAAEIEWTEKAERVALMARRFAQHAEAAKAEADRLRGLVKSAETAENNLRTYLMREMKRQGKDVVSGPLAKIRIQLANPSARYAGDVDALPPELVRERVDREFAASVALEWHKAGTELPEGVTVERTPYVRIY